MEEAKLYAYCLQGDVTEAYEYLRTEPDKSIKSLELESKFYHRFFSEKPMYCFKSEDPWIRKVLLAYYQYFTSVLTRKSVEEAENKLMLSLRELVPAFVAVDDLDPLEEKLETIFKKKGYWFLGGVTPPFRGPYIWKTTVKKEFRVELPHHSQEVRVYFLSDFILQSWAHFATFGEKFAGGWAKIDGLYYVNERPKKMKINLENSEFQVSYLQHEAQHLSDYTRFPNLQAKDLEYRAKLVELIYEPNSNRLLKKFFYEKKNNLQYPHPYSSFVIMKRLSRLAFGEDEILNLEQWKTIDSTRIHKWALALYDEHTEQVLSNGNGTEEII
jgi:hypothetical protein